MKVKFLLRKDRIVCNRLTLSSIEFMIRILTKFVNNEITFDKLRELNPLYSVEFGGRPNCILCGVGVYYVIDYSNNRSNSEVATNTDRVFWEIYNNPGPYQNNNSPRSISFLKVLANKSIEELNKQYLKYIDD